MLKKAIQARKLAQGIERGERIVRWGLVGLAVLLFGFIAVCSLIFIGYYPPYNEVVMYRPQNLFFGIVVIGLFMALVCILYWACLKFKLEIAQIQRFGFWVVIFSGVFWVLVSRCYPYGEPMHLIGSAYSFMEGDYSAFAQGGYLFIYPFQLPYTAFLEAVYTVFGKENHMTVYLFNIICLAGVYAATTRIAQHMFQKDAFAHFLSILLMLGCVYLTIFTTFVYAILPGLSLSLLAVLCVFKYFNTHRLRHLILGAASMALAVLLKSNFTIFAVAIGLILFVTFFKSPDKSIPIALAVFFIFSFGMKWMLFSYYESRSGIEIGQGCPAIVWTAMGLEDTSYMAPGWYTGTSYTLYGENGFDQSATSAAAKEKIAESLARMANNGDAIPFFFWKTVSQWNETTMGCQMPSYYLENPEIRSAVGFSLFHTAGYEALLFIMDKVHMLVYCGALLCIIMRCRKLTVQQLLPFVIILGGFLFHTFFWEGKSQYIASYFVLAIPYAAAGYADAARCTIDKAPRIWQWLKMKFITQT